MCADVYAPEPQAHASRRIAWCRIWVGGMLENTHTLSFRRRAIACESFIERQTFTMQHNYGSYTRLYAYILWGGILLVRLLLILQVAFAESLYTLWNIYTNMCI